MKQFLMIWLLVSPMAFYAQSPRPAQEENIREDTELQTKRLTLALHLSDTQSTQVAALLENQKEERPKRPENLRHLSSEAREKWMSDRLDAQIAFQREMETILSPDQFSQFRKMMGKYARKRKESLHRMRK